MNYYKEYNQDLKTTHYQCFFSLQQKQEFLILLRALILGTMYIVHVSIRWDGFLISERLIQIQTSLKLDIVSNTKTFLWRYPCTRVSPSCHYHGLPRVCSLIVHHGYWYLEY